MATHKKYNLARRSKSVLGEKPSGHYRRLTDEEMTTEWLKFRQIPLGTGRHTSPRMPSSENGMKVNRKDREQRVQSLMVPPSYDLNLGNPDDITIHRNIVQEPPVFHDLSGDLHARKRVDTKQNGQSNKPSMAKRDSSNEKSDRKRDKKRFFSLPLHVGNGKPHQDHSLTVFVPKQDTRVQKRSDSSRGESSSSSSSCSSENSSPRATSSPRDNKQKLEERQDLNVSFSLAPYGISPITPKSNLFGTSFSEAAETAAISKTPTSCDQEGKEIKTPKRRDVPRSVHKIQAGDLTKGSPKVAVDSKVFESLQESSVDDSDQEDTKQTPDKSLMAIRGVLSEGPGNSKAIKENSKDKNTNHSLTSTSASSIETSTDGDRSVKKKVVGKRGFPKRNVGKSENLIDESDILISEEVRRPDDREYLQINVGGPEVDTAMKKSGKLDVDMSVAPNFPVQNTRGEANFSSPCIDTPEYQYAVVRPKQLSKLNSDCLSGNRKPAMASEENKTSLKDVDGEEAAKNAGIKIAYYGPVYVKDNCFVLPDASDDKVPEGTDGKEVETTQNGAVPYRKINPYKEGSYPKPYKPYKSLESSKSIPSRITKSSEDIYLQGKLRSDFSHRASEGDITAPPAQVPISRHQAPPKLDTSFTSSSSTDSKSSGSKSKTSSGSGTESPKHVVSTTSSKPGPVKDSSFDSTADNAKVKVPSLSARFSDFKSDSNVHTGKEDLNTSSGSEIDSKSFVKPPRSESLIPNTSFDSNSGNISINAFQQQESPHVDISATSANHSRTSSGRSLTRYESPNINSSYKSARSEQTSSVHSDQTSRKSSSSSTGYNRPDSSFRSENSVEGEDKSFQPHSDESEQPAIDHDTPVAAPRRKQSPRGPLASANSRNILRKILPKVSPKQSPTISSRQNLDESLSGASCRSISDKSDEKSPDVTLEKLPRPAAEYFVNAEVHHALNTLDDAILESSQVTSPNMVKRQSGHFVVVAIDFGTTYSGYAFSFTRDPDSIHMMRKWEGGDPGVINQKTPTTILLTPEGKFHSFGFSARDYYHDLDPQESKDWLYFERFKMVLHHKQDLGPDTEVTASNGKSMSAMTVFSYALFFFKEHVLQELSDQSGMKIINEDIRWVITVPAIWKAPAKQFMRQAAYEAGLASPEFPEQLLIALEPEAASIYCRKLRMHQLIPEGLPEQRPLQSPKNTKLEPMNVDLACPDVTSGTRYMVVDCGGGTVDITVHQLDTGGRLNELYKASGGPYGAIGVDMEFERLLCGIFGTEFIDHFKLKRPAGWVDLMIAFESRKRSASPYKTSSLNVSLPFSFIDYFKKCKGGHIDAAVKKFGDKDVRWSSQGMLRLSQSAMRRLFLPTLDRIKQAIGDVLNNPNTRDLRFLFLVGGFAESALLQQDIRMEFGHLMKVIIPQGVGLTILKGAVLFGLDPTVVNVRRSRLTYGVGVLNRFKPEAHPEDKKVMKDGVAWCTDVFDKFVVVDQPIALGDTVLRSYTPVRPNQTMSIINIYCSDTTDPSFITDNGVRKCGTLKLDLGPMQSPPPQTRREIQARMMFGDTEIKVSALDVTTGKGVHASIDFLNK